MGWCRRPVLKYICATAAPTLTIRRSHSRIMPFQTRRCWTWYFTPGQGKRRGSQHDLMGGWGPLDNSGFYKEERICIRLHSVKQLRIPRAIIAETELHLQRHALVSEEGMVVWSGVVEKDTRIVRTCLHPRQRCTVVGVDVPIEESQRINGVLNERGETLLAQVHSHPGGVFHSNTDNNFAVTFTLGFVSIVVPFFGR